MNPLQLVLVGTVMELAVFVFEVPTGVVADTYSRRLSIIIGWIVFGVGLVVAGSVPSFGVVLLGWAIWGDVPAPHTWAGAAVVAGSGLYVVHRERVRAAQERATLRS